MVPNTQENKNYRQGRKSLSSTLLHSQQNEISKKSENLRLPSIQKNGDDFDLNPSDRSSPPINKKNKSPQQNKLKIEDNPENFIDLNNSSHFFCLDDKTELDKAQNYLFYYPYQNPEFIISLYNNVKVHRIQKFNKKSPYTISFVISEKIKQKAIVH